MYKTRSLNPYFGKFRNDSKYRRDAYLRRTIPAGTSTEDYLMGNHAWASTINNGDVIINYPYPGAEKLISTENRYKPNDCYHERYCRVNFPYSYGEFSGGYIYFHPYIRVGDTKPAAPYAPTIRDLHLERLSSIGSELRAEAYWNMKPKFEGEVSMLNFLFELKDFRDIAKNLFSSNPKKNPLVHLADRIRGYHPSRKQLDAMSKHPPRTPPTKAAAEAQLLYSFAIVPTINDVKAIFKQLHEIVDDAQKQFIEDGVKGTTRHSSHRFDPVATSWSPVNSGLYYNKGTRTQQTFTATASMFYKYSPRSKFNAFCAYWGLVPNAEAVWNGLPFSFLCDYFFTVAKSLKRMRTDPNLSAYSLVTYMESLLTLHECGYFAYTRDIPTQPTAGLIVDDTYFASVSEENRKLLDGYQLSYYQRWVNARPYYGPSMPHFKSANTNQIKNMAALARCMF